MHVTGWKSLALALLLAATSWSCTYPPTEVLVAVDTDAPATRALAVSLAVRGGNAIVGDAGSGAFVRGGGGRATLPGTFAVTPGGAANDSNVTLTLTAELAQGGPTEPAVSFRRIVRFRFNPRTPSRIPIFLAVRCGNAAPGCTTPGVVCTVAQRCEEQGLTCGDRGECISPEVMPMPIVDSGSDAVVDAASDIAPTNDASDTMQPDVAIDSGFDAGTDLGPQDTGVDSTPIVDTGTHVQPDITMPIDSGPPRSIVVSNTQPTGAGSLADAIAYVNANCATIPHPFSINFDVPMADPGWVPTMLGNRVWRFTSVPTNTITCADVILDGSTQAGALLNTNPTSFGGMPVGASAVVLTPIEGPEIELRGVDLSIGARNVVVRGIAMRGMTINAPSSGSLVEDCMFDSEPDQLVPIPVALRGTNNVILYMQNQSAVTIRHNVFVWQVGNTPDYNGVTANSCDTITFEDNYTTGAGGNAPWDELHFNPAVNVTVRHNLITGSAWEFHLEWVGGPASGGQLVENTFSSSVPMISMGGAGTMAANLTIP